MALYNFSKQKEKVIDQQNLIVKDALFVKDKQCFRRINFSDIVYIKSDNVYLDLLLIDGKRFTIRGTLNNYIEKLSKDFFRCHRSYIINLQFMENFDTHVVVVKGEKVPLTKVYREELLNNINKG